MQIMTVISGKWDSLSRSGWPSDRWWAWRRWSGRRPACRWRSGTAGTAAGAPRCGLPQIAADQSESGYMCWLPYRTTEIKLGHLLKCLITFIHILKLFETFFFSKAIIYMIVILIWLKIFKLWLKWNPNLHVQFKFRILLFLIHTVLLSDKYNVQVQGLQNKWFANLSVKSYLQSPCILRSNVW